MSSRILILIAFGIWCAICSYWYVCNIKGVCGKSTQIESPNVVQPGYPQDSLGIDSSEFYTDGQPLTTLPTVDEHINTTPDNLDRVQIETLEDHAIIHFPYNSTRREDNAAMDDYLSRLASALIASRGTVYIVGHTDMIGDRQFNKQMGLKRAQHIKNILTEKGVQPNQIQCSSKGEVKPVASNDTPRGRYMNRRVEIRLNP
ncbi:MAG: OmpA family protein [Saprospiraceae bacterium]